MKLFNNWAFGYYTHGGLEVWCLEFFCFLGFWRAWKYSVWIVGLFCLIIYFCGLGYDIYEGELGII